VTGGAFVLGSRGARVTGTVNSHAQPTSDRFEFGHTPSYGASTNPVAIGSGFANVPASARLTELSPNTTYHYRLDATNPTDTIDGADRAFTTPPLPIVGAVTVKPKTWRLGTKLVQIIKTSKRPPVGTKIRF